MARRPAGPGLFLALPPGVEMQVEMLFVDAPRGDLLIARAALLALAGALAVRRRGPVIAVAGAFAVLTVLERLGDPVDANLVGPFFATLILCYSLGAHAEGRQFHAGLAVLFVAAPITIRLDNPPGGAGDFLFVATIVVGGPILLGRLVRARVKLNQALAGKAAAAEGQPQGPAGARGGGRRGRPRGPAARRGGRRAGPDRGRAPPLGARRAGLDGRRGENRGAT